MDMSFNEWLPVIFMGVMGLAMLAYVVLDGYDLGVGMLLRSAEDEQKDTMIASIGPFWDANETWLVLGVGILLTCFPLAHGVILGSLYLPVAVMLVGLILRGVAFDFRVKARIEHKAAWNNTFFAGSMIAALSQGWMLGFYILGLDHSPRAYFFAAVIAVCLAAGYCLLGATWLIMKTEGDLQLRAVRWAQRALWVTALGVAIISLITPWVSPRIFDKWFTLPYVVLLIPIPAATATLFWVIGRSLRRLPLRFAQGNEYGASVPFFSAIGIFVLAFYGLSYSLFPYLVVDRITIWQAASAPESLKIILAGALVVLPAIIGYTVFSYRVFSGKARDLTYD
ncbi:MAG: cytochrome d ubiquinol oxidase subunit II [Gammaproteobacteria bacterium]|jgi:cytochrome d ubiquinol oxidase subunit II|nr:cytochrome d ubiquinol oxidase subunit II [Gammaproteobacteria bacterium]MBU0785824.1 cytochrome d ubiquinol oxidase subunit II [Gammaproteobacteria bacterium]MBU0815795.1 cytochrome d ubiquinol oxidase subunit II [Gammaproteobacteria bacterium]MBU1787334.1 cytochrome d ubiquinol oxidase subunit II [Gammaproteobacteria bacterium]